MNSPGYGRRRHQFYGPGQIARTPKALRGGSIEENFAGVGNPAVTPLQSFVPGYALTARRSRLAPRPRHCAGITPTGHPRKRPGPDKRKDGHKKCKCLQTST